METETTTPSAPSTSFFDAGAAEGAAAPASPAPQGAATPSPEGAAAPETPALPDYEHEALKNVQGGKYRTFADLDKAHAAAVDQIRRVSDEAKAAKMRLGQFQGPPVDEEGKPRAYNLAVPEDFPLPLDPESDTFKAVQDIATRYGAPEGMLQELHDKVMLPQISALLEHRMEVEQQALAEFYGSPEAMLAGTRETSRWLVETVGADKTDLLRRAMSSADAAYVFDLIRKGWGNVSLADKGQGAAALADTEQTILAMRASDPELKDPANQARWRAYAEAEAARRSKAA